MHEIAQRAKEIYQRNREIQQDAAKSAMEALKQKEEGFMIKNLNEFLKNFGFEECNMPSIELEENAELSGSPNELPFAFQKCEFKRTCPHCGASFEKPISNLLDLGSALEEKFAEYHLEGRCKPVPGMANPVVSEVPQTKAFLRSKNVNSELLVEILPPLNG
jgi:hypothetical protein